MQHRQPQAPTGSTQAAPVWASKQSQYFWPPALQKASLLGFHLLLFLALEEVKGICWRSALRQRHLQAVPFAPGALAAAGAIMDLNAQTQCALHFGCSQHRRALHP